MSTVKTLIIYELVPEEIHRLVIDLPEGDFELLSKANDTYINAMDLTDEQQVANLVINQMCCQNEEYKSDCTNDLERKYFGAIKDHEFERY